MFNFTNKQVIRYNVKRQEQDTGSENVVDAKKEYTALKNARETLGSSKGTESYVCGHIAIETGELTTYAIKRISFTERGYVTRASYTSQR